MALTQAICNSFKGELLGGLHDVDTDVFKIAFFRAGGSIVGSFGAATTNYSDMGADEVSGTGYTAGGGELTGGVIATSGSTAFLDFDDFTLLGATVTIRGALIYNSSKANRALAVWDFGLDRVVTDGTLTVQFPEPDATNALLRLSSGHPAMATLTKYQVFVEDLIEGVHDFDNHVFKILLTNTAPVVGTHTLRSQTTELATANGYTSGGATTTMTTSRAAGVAKVVASDVVFTAAGGTIGPFRYAVLYNDTPTSPLDPLIGYWDYGSSITLQVGETFTVDCDATNGILTLT